MRRSELKRHTRLKPRATKASQTGHRASGAEPPHKVRPDYMPKRSLRRRRKTCTKAEAAHMTAVTALGCLCCAVDGRGWQPAMLHHIRAGYGGSQRASHWEVVPLCEPHHQGLRFGSNGFVSRHLQPRTWALIYGGPGATTADVELQMLRLVYELLELDFNSIPEKRGSLPPWWEKT